MVDRFNGLWHYAIICCNHDNRNVSQLCTSGSERSEQLMPWSINEGNLLSIIIYHRGTDRLRNPSGFTSCNARFSEVVQKRGLSMIYVSHHSYDWCSLNLFFCLFINIQNLLQISFHKALYIKRCFFLFENNS